MSNKKNKLKNLNIEQKNMKHINEENEKIENESFNDDEIDNQKVEEKNIDDNETNNQEVEEKNFDDNETNNQEVEEKSFGDTETNNQEIKEKNIDKNARNNEKKENSSLNTDNKKVNKNKTFQVLIIGLVVLGVLMVVLMQSVDFRKKTTLNYGENSDLDYNVYLKKNNYYENPYLPKNKKYISSLIDYIDTKFHYTFSAEDDIDMKYDYYIEGTLTINDSDGTSIYQKKYNLLNKKTSTLKGRTFSVDENLKIDYNKYNVVAKNFISEYGISATSKFVVKLYVNIVGEHSNFSKKLTDNGVIQLEIPLMNNLSTVEFNYDLSNRNNVLLEYSTTKIVNPVLFVLCISLILIDVIIICYSIYLLFIRKDASMRYNMQLNKIKKEYDRYISETVTTQKLNELLQDKNLKVVIIKLFDDMLDIRDTIKTPILFFEEIPGVETVFYIMKEDIIYIYVLHVNSFKRRKEKKW